MEEDIKILEKITKEIIYEDNLNTFENESPINIAKAIVNLINRVKELEKYEEYYKDMEEVNKKFIAVDKIKEKIELIKNLNEKIYYEENVISILQELLEEQEDK